MLISFSELIKKYNINPKGVFHIGANNGAECEWYYSNGVERTLWIEALPDVFKELKQVISVYPNAIALNNCVSNVDYKEVTFNVSSNHGESSSMLEFGTHSIHHPDVTFVDKISLTTIRVDTLLNANKIDIRDYDFLNLDLQGAEMLALEGMGDTLRLFKCVYIEVNRDAVYKNCAQFDEVKKYLEDFGFELKEVKWTGANWGDAFFIKKQNMGSVFSRNAKQFRRQQEGIINVPPRFLPVMGFPYPPDNFEIFERWYFNNFTEKSDRLYLPIQWTAFLVNHNFGNDISAISELQSYVRTLDRSKKYYTICQFDLGCMVDFEDLDILVFGMAGGRIDYPLPLLCMPHKYEFHNPKTLFASFIGRKTHPVRDRVFTNLQHRQGCYISENKHDLSSYCSLLASSVFSICCRGFGNNSFRVQESLQYGAIPVIVSDKRLEPHNIPFEEYGVYIDANGEGINCESIYHFLQSINAAEIQEKQSKLKYYYDTYFSYAGNKKIILERLKQN